jgi:hypothetical protein
MIGRLRVYYKILILHKCHQAKTGGESEETIFDVANILLVL